MFGIHLRNDFPVKRFKDVTEGDVFFLLDHNLRVVFLKLRVDPHANVNAVCLSSAMLHHFADSDDVFVMSATLVENPMEEK